MVRRDKPFPIDVVRDLLGITRAMYRAEHAAVPQDRATLDALEQVGRELKMALDLGRSSPGTMGSRAAWSWAEQASTKLGVIVADKALGPAVTATVARMNR